MKDSERRLTALLRLRGIDFFDGLDAKELAAIAAISTEEVYRRAEVIFEQGDMGDHMYILLSGRVEVVRDGELVATLESGDCFGEGAVLDRAARSATIRTVEEVTRLVVIAREDLVELLELYPSVARAICMTLVGRLRTLSDAIFASG